MKKKKSSTLQRCSELTKCPVLETCHHVGPMMARMQPVMMTQARLDHGEHAEDVDPRRHVGGLAVGEELVGREGRLGGVAHPGGPLA